MTEKFRDLMYSDVTQKVIGCAYEVHRTLGLGFPEVIYQRALAYELKKAQLEFLREVDLDIFYKDLEEPIGRQRADFVVENKILVELKALPKYEDVHISQVLNYLRAFRLEVGLLINFGGKSLTFKRLVLTTTSRA
ncbi:MAG TPA: GxxExxY protein [Anaerolineales bacterium]|nr:GxxExxY protein [Anaerolineales bacterium]